MGSAFSLEEVVTAAPGPRWFQTYCMRDHGITRALAERAEAAGYAALCVTVDSPFDGLRERERRANIQFRVPPPASRHANFMPYLQGGSRDPSSEVFLYDPSLTWTGLDWLRGLTRLPLVLKGVLSPEDARLAVEHGVRGIVVSNHGGRQLDTAMTTCSALPVVVDAVAGEAEVFVDGGIRRGTDVLKALALGARAVLIGRPYLWGLAEGGESGVRRILELLREELRVSMALAGCPRISDVKRGLIAGALGPRR
jgi:4-hydroxymandelate oxidase